MRIILNTGDFIDIDDKYLEGLTPKNRDKNTPYLVEFVKPYLDSDFKHRVNCYSNIQDIIKGEYKSYLDLLGGVGLTGKIFNDVPKHSFLNDINPKCVQVLKENYFKGNIFSQDMFNFNFGRTFDLVLADFNDFTLRKYQQHYKEVLTNLFKISDKYVVVNDCSCFSFKFGPKGFENYSTIFGEEIHNLDEYYVALKKYFEDRHSGWKLIHIEAFLNSSFLLFQKGQRRVFTTNYNKSHNDRITLKK